MTFKESILSKLFICANEYNMLIGVDFIITSNLFAKNKVYLLRFHKDNFLHLTGVSTKLYAEDFFRKCLSKTLKLDEFECDYNNEMKGKVREKIRNLLNIGSFFDRKLIFQESFEKNRISLWKCVIKCFKIILVKKDQYNISF